MSNLSELIGGGGGGGGKTADFVASGTIPNGVAVAVNSNGTISEINPDGFPPTAGTASVFESSSVSSISSCYVADNKLMVVYQDNGNNGYITAALGTISGKTITFDTPRIVVSSAGTGPTAAIYYAATDRVIAVYQYSDGYNKIVGCKQSLSGTLLFGTQFSIASNGYNLNFDSIFGSYDPSASRAVVTYYWAYPYYTQYVEVIEINGNTISTGTNYPLGTQGGGDIAHDLTYDSVNSRTIISYYNGGIRMRAMNISSNKSISFGSEYNPSISGYTPKLIYDTAASRIVMHYQETTTPYNVYLIPFAFNGSTFTKGTAVSTGLQNVAFAYDSTANKIGIFGSDAEGQSYPYQAKFKVASLSGSTITVSTIETSIGTSSGSDQKSIVYSPTSEVFLLNYKDNSTNFGNSIAIDSGASNNIDFIGVSAEAISNLATGVVTLRGGVSENLSSLTTNATYYVQTDGTISASISNQKAGKALSSSTLLLVGQT